MTNKTPDAKKTLLRGIKFGDKHSYNNWKLILASQNIGLPEVVTNYVDVPGRDGALDYSEALTGSPVYGNRTLEFGFLAVPTICSTEWHTLLSDVAACLHGQRLKIVIDDDSSHYYWGRCEISAWQVSKSASTITVACTCDPYKYKAQETSVENTLSSEDTEITLTNASRPVVPTITVTAATTITFGSATYSIDKGEHRILGIQLQPGENKIKAKLTASTEQAQTRDVKAQSDGGTNNKITITYHEAMI